jgi:glutamine amidotransferase
MCRHLAYLGRPVPLSSLVLDPPHSLLHQSFAPTDMRSGGTINADGFGIGWYVEGTPEARRYRRSCPMWADASLSDLAATIRSRSFLAAARNATAGMPVTETACAPFRTGRWLFSHNGRVDDWPMALVDLVRDLPAADLLTQAPTDSAALWALVRHRLQAGESPGQALAGTARAVSAADPRARLNFLLTDGETIAATTWTHSLWVRHDEESVVISSEPLDPADARWREVPDCQLVVATAEAVDVRPIDDEGDS